MSDAAWKNDEIQFARLIAELEAAGAFTQEVMEFLEESTDLTYEQISELVDRAQASWERTKAGIIAPAKISQG